MSFGYETTSPDRYRILKTFAKENRKNPTESERIVWDALKKLRCGYRFRRQHPIGDYIVDFICLPKRLVVEIDGEYHDSPEQQKEDEPRARFLENKGFKVLRFTNQEVSSQLRDVIQRIKDELFKNE